MRTRTTLLLVVVAALVAAFVWLYESRLPGTDERRESRGRLLGDLDADAVERIVFERGEDRIELSRLEGDFLVTEPVEDDADDLRVRDLLRELEGLAVRARQGADQIAGGDEATGLGAGAARLTIGAIDRDRVIEVGAAEAPGALRYVRLDDGDEIALVDARVADIARTPLSALRERKLVTFSPFDVGRLVVDNAGERLSFERRGASGERWWIVAPLEDEADAGEVNALLAEIGSLRATGFADPTDRPTAGLDDPWLTIDLASRGADEDRSQVLRAGADRGDGFYWAEVAGRDAIAEVHLSPLLRELERETEDWRSRTILDISPWDVVEVELSRGDERLIVTRVEGETEIESRWAAMEPEGFPLDAGAFDALLGDLESVEALELAAPSAFEEDAEERGLLVVAFRNPERTPPVTLTIGPSTADGNAVVRRDARETPLVMDGRLAERLAPSRLRLEQKAADESDED